MFLSVRVLALLRAFTHTYTNAVTRSRSLELSDREPRDTIRGEACPSPLRIIVFHCAITIAYYIYIYTHVMNYTHAYQITCCEQPAVEPCGASAPATSCDDTSHRSERRAGGI